MSLPVPLMPADVDLRDFEFMPLQIRRLLTSDTWITGSGDARAAAMALWLESWHQVPAGSLLNHDPGLAQLSHSAGNWGRIKFHALRGWVLCADGRLYHPVVCEKALEAWLEKLAQRISSGEGNAKQWKIAFDRGAIEAAMDAAREKLAALNPSSRALRKKRTAKRDKTTELPKAGAGRDAKPQAIGAPAGNPDGKPVGSPDGTPTGNPVGSPQGSLPGIPSGAQETETGTETSKALKASLSADADSGAGEPPQDPPAEPIDPVKVIFDEGLALLKREGVDDKIARKIIGGLRKDHGDTAVLQALVEARTTHPSGPTAWLMKTVPAMAKKAAVTPSPRRSDTPAQRDSYGDL